MDKNTVKSLLKGSLWKENIYCEEYQDKFYLCKALREILPGVTEERIYSAIDGVNKTLKSPIRKKQFIAEFSEKLTS